MEVSHIGFSNESITFLHDTFNIRSRFNNNLSHISDNKLFAPHDNVQLLCAAVIAQQISHCLIVHLNHRNAHRVIHICSPFANSQKFENGSDVYTRVLVCSHHRICLPRAWNKNWNHVACEVESSST